MQELYRAEYEGEYVVTGIVIKDGKRERKHEFIENPLTLKVLSGRAVCLSNGESAKQLNLKKLSTRQGLLDSLALHNYSTGEMYKHYSPEFHVTFNTEILNNLVSENLTEKMMVYTSIKQCINTPGEFYIVPYGVKSTEETVAAYLAAFDGHKEVFLLGYDQYDELGKRRDKLINTMLDVFGAYPGVKFTHVIHQGATPKEWNQFKNVSTVSVAEFLSICDVSTGQWHRK